ncbi:MAG: hypothetical protein CSYNP_00722 [Syntrophus sp. SKADARSKE-3]|nr:hypothetical protein [Syntrophus sp. SKADARSKE-3]
MEDERKTRKQLIDELNEQRKRVAELENLENEIKQTRESQEKFAKAFLKNSIPMTITTLPGGRFIDVSDSFLKLMGCKRDEVIGNTTVECGFITEQQRMSYLDCLKKTGQVENLVWKIRTKSGRLIDGLFNAVMMSINSEKYLLTAIIDVTEQKRVENALRESEERYRSLFESSVVGINRSLPDGRLIAANTALAKMYGYESVEEAMADVHNIARQHYAHPEERDEILRILAEHGEMKPREVTAVRRDGTRFTALVVIHEIRDSNKNLLYYQSEQIDLTEIKQLEAKLRLAEERYSFLINNTSDYVARFNLDSTMIFGSAAMYPVTGYKPEEIIGTSSFDRLHPDDFPQVRAALKMAIETGLNQRVEYRSRCKTGEYKWVELSGKMVLNDHTGKKEIVAVIRDISTRKRIEEALQRSEKKFHTLYDATSDAVLLMTEDGFFDCNKAALAIFGCTDKDEIYWKHPADFSPPLQPCGTDSAALANQMIAKAMEKGCINFEWLHKRIDSGKTFPADVLLTAMVLDGKPAIQAVVRDITDRKQAETELIKYRERLEHLVEERTRELQNKSTMLEELNVAMKVLLRHREDEKKNLEDKVVMNIKNLIIPFMQKMKSSGLNNQQMAYLQMIETHTNDITSLMAKKMHQFNFTRTEIDVASLIKEGKKTRDIAKIIGIANSSINTHRNNIRKKLGISKEKVNLRSHLQSLEE